MSERPTVQVVRPLVLSVPTVPNYLQVVGDEGPESTRPIDVASLTDEQLREVGAAWTNALIAHASKRRERTDVTDE